jgi:hypothetical protein
MGVTVGLTSDVASDGTSGKPRLVVRVIVIPDVVTAACSWRAAFDHGDLAEQRVAPNAMLHD